MKWKGNWSWSNVIDVGTRLKLYLSGQYLIAGENQFLGGKSDINQHLFKSSLCAFAYLIGMLSKKQVSLMLMLICTVFLQPVRTSFENKELNSEIIPVTCKIGLFWHPSEE